MSSEWQTVEIASLCLGIYDGPHATPKKTTIGPVFLGISSLNNGQGGVPPSGVRAEGVGFAVGALQGPHGRRDQEVIGELR